MQIRLLYSTLISPRSLMVNAFLFCPEWSITNWSRGPQDSILCCSQEKAEKGHSFFTLSKVRPHSLAEPRPKDQCKIVKLKFFYPRRMESIKTGLRRRRKKMHGHDILFDGVSVHQMFEHCVVIIRKSCHITAIIKWQSKFKEKANISSNSLLF